MNILLATQLNDDIRSRYLLLELDSFRTQPEAPAVAAYCLLERLPLDEMLVMQQYLDLHGNLMSNYRKRNWNYVEQAIDHLKGKWNQQLDSFYQDLAARTKTYKDHEPEPSWDGIVDRF